MASHNHCHHHFSPSCCSCSCSCCCSCYNNPPLPLPQSHSSSSSSSASSDPLLQALATHLLQSQPPPPHFYTQYIKKTNHHLSPQRQSPTNISNSNQTQALLQTLLRRVAALEVSLRELSTSSYPSPSSSSSTSSSSSSLRDVAARTIQARFRAFLARRSKTLRQLRLLASIKSSVAALKLSLSERAHFRPEAHLQKATDLLTQLDSIQSGDWMIREGKRSIGIELVRLLDVLEGASHRRKEIPLKSMKKVSFADNRKESGVFMSAQYPDEEESSHLYQPDTEDSITFVEKLSRKVKGGGDLSGVFVNDEEAHVELEGFQELGDEDKNPMMNLNGVYDHGMNGVLQAQNGKLGLSAPMPVQMEPRGSVLLKKKKIVRVISS